MQELRVGLHPKSCAPTCVHTVEDILCGLRTVAIRSQAVEGIFTRTMHTRPGFLHQQVREIHIYGCNKIFISGSTNVHTHYSQSLLRRYLDLRIYVCILSSPSMRQMILPATLVHNIQGLPAVVPF